MTNVPAKTNLQVAALTLSAYGRGADREPYEGVVDQLKADPDRRTVQVRVDHSEAYNLIVVRERDDHKAAWAARETEREMGGDVAAQDRASMVALQARGLGYQPKA